MRQSIRPIRRIIVVLSFALATAIPMPADTGERIYDFYSPTFLSEGATVVGAESPQADIFNPAIGAGAQRTILDVSYLGIADGSEGYLGHAVNIGNTIPTKVGVVSWSGHFISSSLSEYTIGAQGGLRASFAKDLFPKFHVGAGVNLSFGSGWALTASLGVINYLGDLGPLKDFTWGAALQEMGYATFNAEVGDYPPLFTLAGGASCVLIDNEIIRLKALTEISVPGFTNFRFRLGGTVTFIDTIYLSFNSVVDVDEIRDAGAATMIPAFGVGFTYKLDLKGDISFLNITERGWNRGEIKVQTAAAPLRSGIWGFGLGANVPLGVLDRNPPRIAVEYPEALYLSPNLDGISDDLVLPITITDERYVAGYRFFITDPSGAVIREIRNKEYRPENEQEKTIFERFAAVKSGIAIPDSILWAGLSDEGSTVPDGTYAFAIEAWDDNGNIATEGPYTIHIDNTPPTILLQKIEGNDLIFSPNGDGAKDTIRIVQEGSREDRWVGKISDVSGTIHRTLQWSDNEPESFSWDGTDDAGALLPDGIYAYTITAVDRAGNVANASIDNIFINTQVTPITMQIDRSTFSPNGDGEKDTVLFTLGIPVKTGIDTWEIEIVDSTGRVRRTVTGEGTIPAQFLFDGMDNRNKRLDEGSYTGTLRVRYFNGNHPQSVTPPFVLDTTAPQGVVRSDLNIFSPNGDGNKDEIIIYQETSLEEQWVGRIIAPDGSLIRRYVWIEKADPSFIWDGRAEDGKLCQDGTYTYQLLSTDRAGNTGTSNEIAFELNTEETPVILTIEYDAFSPNSDGVRDTIRIIPQMKITEGIDTYRIIIDDENGNEIRAVTGKGKIDFYRWDGTASSGRKVPDGTYVARIEILYKNGNNPKARSMPFTVDTVYPTVSLKTEYLLFSPNGDGKRDSVIIDQTGSNELLWEGAVVSRNGTVLRRFFWKGIPDRMEWNGTDEAGNLMPDDSYSYRISATDPAGNTGNAEIPGIVIDNRQTPVFITTGGKGFSPNNDGFSDTISFNTIVTLRSGIVSWKIDLVRDRDIVEFSFEGGDRIPSSVIWDGKNTQGAIVEGTYSARFTVTYEKGDVSTAQSTAVVLDISAPQVAVDMNPIPFSPDNDGVDDDLTIAIAVNDASQIVSWRLVIRTSQGGIFHEFGGEGAPTGKIVWDGRSRKGELVFSAEDYPFTLAATDTWGNTGSIEGLIPVDVLVFRDGEKLKIQIASITFAPNSDLFSTTNEQIVQKNDYVLRRIAQILNKYRNYNITIEGHANPTRWQNPAEAEREEREELQPLSEKRALQVKNALIALGVEASRISVIGMGGTRTLVPPNDRENIWKNRRVEFILVKRR